jgi:hypothetical protein
MFPLIGGQLELNGEFTTQPRFGDGIKPPHATRTDAPKDFVRAEFIDGRGI